jgi:hypothetical protein
MSLRACVRASVLASFGFFGCASADPDAASSAAASNVDARSTAEAATARATVKVVVTVDWEGLDLAEANLQAMEDLRADYPQVRLVQFLNAAYYTKPDADVAAVTASLRRVVRGGDELGLHVHGWKSLFAASGVRFRPGPTFWGTTLTADDCASDCGHEVPISAYTQGELSRVVAYSVDVLAGEGFGRATSFRAGGWMASPAVRGALESQGFRYDHSAVPSTFLAGELKGEPLLAWVGQLWPQTTATTQPYRLGGLTEVADNGALSDYVTAREMLAVFDAAVKQSIQTGTTTVVSIGFHQETATDYLPRLRGALDGIAQREAAGKVRVTWTDSAGAAAR